MTANYVYWRKPTGLPARGEEAERFAPKLLLSELKKSASINKNGGVDFGLKFFDGIETALKSAIVVIAPEGGEINSSDASEILWGGIRNAIQRSKGGEIFDYKSVLVEANSLARQHFKKKIEPYLMVTSLSMKCGLLNCVKIDKYSVAAIPSRKSYKCPKHLFGHQDFVKHINCSEYQPIRVKTFGRSINEAFYSAMRSVNVLRGLWTLHSTYRGWSITIGSAVRKTPIGVIHVGPAHTLYEANGELVAKGSIFWYEPEYFGDWKLYSPNPSEWDKAVKYARWAVRKLKSSPLRQEIEDIVCGYVGALDQSDYNRAFLQMWSVLERLTVTGNGNYEETIKRATWPFVDRGVSKELLSCMRLRRNQYVHAAVKRDDMDQATYLLKGFVDYHINRMLVNRFNAKNIEEYGRQLALSTDINVLKEESRTIRAAIHELMRRR